MGSKRTFGDFSCVGKVTPAERRSPRQRIQTYPYFSASSLFSSAMKVLISHKIFDFAGALHFTQIGRMRSGRFQGFAMQNA